MSILFTLYYEFFKIGLFAVGGGMATIPFLNALIDKFHWFDAAMLADMIAISESTPGPIGINMATFTGYTVASFAGGVIATLGLITPSIIIIIIIAQVLKKFKESTVVQAMFYGLRPAVAGLIAAAGLSIFAVTLVDVNAYQASGNLMDLFQLLPILLFLILLYCTNKYKKHPIFYIAICAVIGVLLKL